MRSRYRVIVPDETYFLTTTIVEWIPVFFSVDACETVTQSLTYCRNHKGLRLYAYVIMDNHVHLVAEAPDLSNVIQAFKRHTARELIALAERSGKEWLLNQFAYYRRRGKNASLHQVWQEGFHPQLVDTADLFWQKVEYIHENPVRRGYVDAPEHWRYSSARDYHGGGLRVMEIDDVEERM